MRTIVAALFLLVPALSHAQQYDLIIANGKIFDGAGNPWFYGDIGIRGDSIAPLTKKKEPDAPHAEHGHEHDHGHDHAPGHDHSHDHGHDEIGVEGMLGEGAQMGLLEEMPIGWALTLREVGIWSRWAARVSGPMFVLFLAISFAPLIPNGPSAKLIGMGNGLAFTLLELWFALIFYSSMKERSATSVPK